MSDKDIINYHDNGIHTIDDPNENYHNTSNTESINYIFFNIR